ncbi:MAG: MSEP-CTERM sorting domain-containing protein [Saprospiraceae bacterium]|nr:MSEP-CTERM sorting domain-containing protein [Saprospiraceae bacterium]
MRQKHVKSRKIELSDKYGLISLTTHVSYIIFYFNYFEEILWRVPRWMITPDFELYVVTFLMPTIAHALFVLVLKLSFKNETVEKPWLNLLIAMLIPFVIFLFLQIVTPFWSFNGSDLGILFNIVILCFFALLFLFFIIRGVYAFTLRRQEKPSKYAIIWKILIAIVCPIAGLILNQVIMNDVFWESNSGIFGNFGNIGFLGIAVVNGILVCLPERENPTYRLALFTGRMIGFAYVSYFFLVFLPYLPLSIFAVLVIGFGFLMLTPLVLFIVQSRLLSTDFTFLKNHYSKDKLRIITVVAFLVIPTFITFNYLNDKKVLNETLDYVYYPDYSKKYDLNETAIKRIISNIKSHKKTSRGFLSNNSHTPFLSRFYTWLVLDNMTLSDNKINKIESIFLGESSTRTRNTRNRNDGTVDITNIETETKYDAGQDAWLTWVDLEMTNWDTIGGQREYDIVFDLPTGCYISDYFLDIEGRREHGILSEKRAAVWIYQQITNTNRDPGLLNYIAADKVHFRVFPFLKNEVRTTGIQFLHKEPVIINIDNQAIQLGNLSQQKPITTATDLTKNVVYVSAFAKSKLPTVKRKPYYHFIVDISKEMKYNSDTYAPKIEQFIAKNKIDLTKTAFNFTNKYSTISNGKDWKIQLGRQKFEGGFYLERAIEKALFNAYENRKNEYPIIVLVGKNNLEHAILEDDFSNFKMIYPELNQYYKIEENGDLTGFDLTQNSKFEIDSTVQLSATPTVLAYPNTENPIAYLPNDGKASIVLKIRNC